MRTGVETRFASFKDGEVWSAAREMKTRGKKDKNSCQIQRVMFSLNRGEYSEQGRIGLEKKALKANPGYVLLLVPSNPILQS
jgi:hypothetical protein